MYGLNLDGKRVDDNLKYYALKEKKVIKSTNSPANNNTSFIDIPCEDDDLVAVYVEQEKYFYVAYRKDKRFRLIILGTNINVHYYIFSSKLNKQGEYGIEYHNEQGNLVYSSNHSYLRIFGKINYFYSKATMAFPKITELKKNPNQKVGYILGTQFGIPRTNDLTVEIPAIAIQSNKIDIDNVKYTRLNRKLANIPLHYLIDFFFADLTNL